jgi:MerR family transcriptional regulator, redox-sensitive transcriptional activator SoxR
VATLIGVDATLSIGDFAARAGISVPTVRFYEAQGLIRSSRSSGNQRRFPRAELRRVAFVRAGRAVGLPLADIAAALAELPTDRTPNRRDWQLLSARWRRRLDKQIEDLVGLRDRLDGCIGCGCLSLRRCALYNLEDKVAGYGAGARLLTNSDPADVRE